MDVAEVPTLLVSNMNSGKMDSFPHFIDFLSTLLTIKRAAVIQWTDSGKLATSFSNDHAETIR